MAAGCCPVSGSNDEHQGYNIGTKWNQFHTTDAVLLLKNRYLPVSGQDIDRRLGSGDQDMVVMFD